MPRLSQVQVLYAPDLNAAIEVRFVTTTPLFDTCDTAVLRVVASHTVDLELAIRIERRRITDVQIWEPSGPRRHELPTHCVIVADTEVHCIIPRLGTARIAGMPRLSAQLTVNGALIQRSVPVDVAASAAVIALPQRARRLPALELALA